MASFGMTMPLNPIQQHLTHAALDLARPQLRSRAQLTSERIWHFAKIQALYRTRA
jgi:hypothetical protein